MDDAIKCRLRHPINGEQQSWPKHGHGTQEKLKLFLRDRCLEFRTGDHDQSGQTKKDRGEEKIAG